MGTSKTIMSRHRDIIHIDLSLGAKRLAASAHGVFVILWWRDVPLGQLEIEASQLPMSASEMAAAALDAIAPALDAYLAATGLDDPMRLDDPTGLDDRRRRRPVEGEAPRLLRAALSLLDRAPEAQSPTVVAAPSVSVVVPTCHRPRRLAACLGSLGDLRQEPLEIIVVDNAPADATREVVESFPGVRYVAEERRGSSAARNAGVAHSRGQLVAFVDDDETVHPDWLSRLLAAFRDPDVALVTGLVLPSELETEAQLIFEERYSFARGYVARTFDAELYRRTRYRGVPVWEIGGSGNLAIRRDVFHQVGGFDERLGAGRAGGCEELELFYRVLAAGLSCRYEPRAVTEHQHRRDLESLEQQLHDYMRGHVASVLVQLDNHHDFGNLWHLLWTLPKVYAGYALRCLLRDPAYPADLLAAEVAGGLAGIGYYRQYRVSGAQPAERSVGSQSVGSQSVGGQATGGRLNPARPEAVATGG